MSEEKKDLYIGKTKVKEIIRKEEVNLVGVLLENNKSMNFTVEQYENTVSEEAYDDGLISIRMWDKTIGKVLKLLTRERVDLKTLPWLLERVLESVNQNGKKALCEFYNVDHEQDIMLYDIDVKLRGTEKANASLNEPIE